MYKGSISWFPESRVCIVLLMPLNLWFQLFRDPNCRWCDIPFVMKLTPLLVYLLVFFLLTEAGRNCSSPNSCVFFVVIVVRYVLGLTFRIMYMLVYWNIIHEM